MKWVFAPIHTFHTVPIYAALKVQAAEHQAKLAQETRQRNLKLKLEEERKAQRLTAVKLKAQQRAEVRQLRWDGDLFVC